MMTMILCTLEIKVQVIIIVLSIVLIALVKSHLSVLYLYFAIE
jgi:hypothetical protein